MRWKLIYTAFLSAGMSGLVALIVTIVNTGVDGGLVLRWLRAWGIAFPAAWFAALIWGPTARRLAKLFARPPGDAS